MNIYLLLSFLATAVCLVIADIVYHRNKQNLSNRLFALFSLLIAYWLFTQEFMCRQASDLKTALLWTKVGALWFVSLPVFVHFLFVFTENARFLKKRLIYIVLYLPALFFAWLQLTSESLGKVEKKSWGYSVYNLPSDPRLFQFFFVWALIIVFVSILFMLRYYFKTTDRIKKNQVRLIFLGVSVGGLLGISETLLEILGVRIPELTAIEMTYLNLCIGYAIWKYQLFVIDPAMAAENIIATMPDSLLLVDLTGKIVRINPSLGALLKYGESDIVGRVMPSLFMEKELAEAIQAELHKRNLVTNYEAELQTALGQTVPVLVSGSTVRDKKEEIVGTVYIIRDITERKQNEAILQNYAEKLKRINYDLQEFVYVASHDLQEPLRKIMVFGERLQQKCGETLNEQGQDYLNRMQNAAERMRTLITDLLTYSRVSMNKQPPVPVDLGVIVKEVLVDLEVMIEQTGGEIEVDQLPIIEADPTQMRQLFQNVISNALKYHQPDKSPLVKISARIFKEKSELVSEISIADNGIGIEKSNFERIFGIFQRLHGRNEYEGTGIGLAVCKKIVENHQGTIRVESMPGEGSVFTIKLPVKQEI